MSDVPAGDVTQHLRAAAEGQPGAADALMRLVFGELRRLAEGRMLRQPASHTLQPTALVNEAYVRLFGRGEPTWENRKHFFFAASRAMRDILVDHARRRSAKKRGGGLTNANIDPDDIALMESEDFLELHEVIEKLEQSYPEVAQVVMLRYYAGLSREQAAEVLQTSPAKVWRDWEFAKSWLQRHLKADAR